MVVREMHMDCTTAMLNNGCFFSAGGGWARCQAAGHKYHTGKAGPNMLAAASAPGHVSALSCFLKESRRAPFGLEPSLAAAGGKLPGPAAVGATLAPLLPSAANGFVALAIFSDKVAGSDSNSR